MMHHFLWKIHTQNFVAKLKAHIPLDSKEHEELLNWLAYGTCSNARSYTCYIVNEERFLKYMLIGKVRAVVFFYEATTVCIFSTNDISQVVDLVGYYGRVDCNVFYVLLFWCQWAVKDGFTLVNLNHNQVTFSRDPYILVSRASQVFYLKEDESSSCHVVMRGLSKRNSDKDLQEGITDFRPLLLNVEINVKIDNDMDDAENILSDCEGIYVLNVVS